jgi:hypothetical protein
MIPSSSPYNFKVLIAWTTVLLVINYANANTVIVRSGVVSSFNSFRSSFKTCCSQGKEASQCADYSSLSDKSSSCKFAFTVCCTQQKRTNECEVGKKHALAGQSCSSLQKSNSNCDTLTVF